MKMAADGSFSLGLSSTVLPQARALPIIHSGTMAGKLNGVMQATTPTGWRTEWTSTPPATCSERSPLSAWDSPVANSMFSRPRVISPSASERTLPCSLVSRAASSGRRCIEQFADLEEDGGALGEAGGAPAGQGGAGGRDGLLDAGCRGQCDLLLLLAGGRVEDRAVALGVGNQGAVDEVRNAFHGVGLFRVVLCCAGQRCAEAGCGATGGAATWRRRGCRRPA